MALVLVGLLIWEPTATSEPLSPRVPASTPVPSPDNFTSGAPATRGGAALPVLSFPPAARVFLDLEDVGRTPLNLENLEARPYALAVEADGYAPLDSLIYLAPGKNRPVIVMLQKRAEPATPAIAPTDQSQSAGASARSATLAIHVSPWGSVFVDGDLVARDTDIKVEVDVPLGRHRVRAVHPELGTLERTVSVGSKGSSVTLDLAAASE